jgi:hypothetical protein
MSSIPDGDAVSEEHMSKRDIKRLERAARGLINGIKGLQISAIHVLKLSIADKQHDNGGWWTEFADWHDRNVKIGVSLDRYANSSRRTFWVGFYSRSNEAITRLYKALPTELAPVRRFGKSGDAVEQKEPGRRAPIWVLKDRLPNSMYGRPILDAYQGDPRFFGFYEDSVELDVSRAVNFVASVVLAHESAEDPETTDIRLIDRRSDLPETEKQQMIQARRGQGRFRDDLKAIWKDGCPISGHTMDALLRASHILPWRDANDGQRLNPYNGILLSANLDALFDRHLITFTDEGKLMISTRLPRDEVNRLGLTERIVIPIRDEHKPFLQDHRTRFEKLRSNTQQV